MGTKRRYTLGFSGAGFEHAEPPFEVKYAQSFPDKPIINIDQSNVTMGWYTAKDSKYVYRVLRGCLLRDGERVPVTKMDEIKQFFELNEFGDAQRLKYYPVWRGTGGYGRDHFYCEGDFNFKDGEPETAFILLSCNYLASTTNPNASFYYGILLCTDEFWAANVVASQPIPSEGGGS